MTRLSAIDAFFVAYQQRAGIAMTLAATTRVEGSLDEPLLLAALGRLVAHWPRLGQRLAPGWLGLRWQGPGRTEGMLVRSEDPDWGHQPLDPFTSPPLQLRWQPGAGSHILAMRAHHSLCDGAGLLAICDAFVVALGALDQGCEPQLPLAPTRSWRWPRLLSWWPLLRYHRRLGREARLERGARLSLDSLVPGPTTSWSGQLAATIDTWQILAAWLRAILRHNRQRDPASSALLSVEVPVRDRGSGVLGNQISPLLLFARADQPRQELAAQLRAEFRDLLAQQAHLAVPLLAAPGALLPWSLFERIAVNPQTTGFATTHFVRLQGDPAHTLDQASQGGLKMVEVVLNTPVCLKMGAALVALQTQTHLQLFITWRRTGLSLAAAEGLGALLLEELACPGS